MKTWKKWLIVLVVATMLVMLIPVRLQQRDGGTVVYRAVLYEVVDKRKTAVPVEAGEPQRYIGGVVVRILGIEVYNSVDN